MNFSMRSSTAVFSFMLLILIAACSSKPFLIVNYQLPESADSLEGIQTSLRISDVRENKAFLSANAKKSLKKFNDTYSLVVLQADGSGNLLGLYQVDALMAEIFKQRLNSHGVQVSAIPDNTPNTLEIRLKQFKLDLVGQKWIVTMNYQANLLRNGQPVASESVDGSAERLKVTGKGDAEKLLGELITDMVNKLDVNTIFERAQR